MTVRPAAMIEEELAERLKGARRLAVVGIGDELHRADRFGILAAKGIEALRLPGVRVFLAGTTPESFTAPIRRYRPDHVLLLDAADMGAEPGTVGIIAPGAVSGTRLSTHALPLSVVIEYIERTAKARVTLVGFQPDFRTAAIGPTPAEQEGLARLVGAVRAAAERAGTSRP